MIEWSAVFNIITRILALLFLVRVFYTQLWQFRIKRLLIIKSILTSTVALLIFDSLFKLSLNFFRGADGNLLDGARHTSLIVSGITTLMVAISFWLIYRSRDE